ncbi:MAG: peptidylprolyl isomerase [Nitrososphaerales archaeon]|jgi:peptidyl-prolyl cis-trans isomerase B (cyclophilin B)
MSRRSRRAKKRSASRRNLWIGVAVVVILVVGVVGYVVATRGGAGTATTSAGAGPFAVLDTSQGTIVLQLFPQDAPKTVANFESLANSGFYNDLVWHRIVAGFIIQTGDPTSRDGGGNPADWGDTGSNTTIPFETNSLPNAEGYVAMANTAPQGDGASSQFFIDLADNTNLNGQYTVFAQVVSGMNAVLAIGALPVSATCASSGQLQCPPVDPGEAMLLSVTIETSLSTTSTTASTSAAAS